MALVSSGEISIGGSTTGRSINLELGKAAGATSSLNDTDLRSLAGISTGAISLSNFYGKSSFTHEYFIRTYGTFNANNGFSAISTDSSTNVYLTGYIGSEGGGLYIVKTNLNGVVQWQRSLGAYEDTWGYGIGYDSSGNVYVSGSNIDGNLVVAKYNSNGTIQWQRILFSPNGGQGNCRLASTSAGNIYIFTTTTVPFYDYNFLTVKYDTNGNLQWQRTLFSQTNNSDNAYDIAIDSSENLYVVGQTGWETSRFVAKYNSSGTLQWQKSIGTNIDDGSGGGAYAVAVDASSNVYICGGQKPFIAKYNTNGALQWQREVYNGYLSDAANGIAVDSSGNPFLFTDDSAPSGPFGYEKELFAFTKYDTNGTLQWRRFLQNTTNEVDSVYSFYMAKNSTSNLYCVGGEYNSGFRNVFIKVTGDGSRTGTYGNYTYGVLSGTSYITTYNDLTRTFTETAASLTNTVSTYTDAARTYTPTVISL